MASRIIKEQPGKQHQTSPQNKRIAIFAFKDGRVTEAPGKATGDNHNDEASHEKNLRDRIIGNQPFDDGILQGEAGITCRGECNPEDRLRLSVSRIHDDLTVKRSRYSSRRAT
ncbi:hypothetical protein D9M70_586100 [compost metagenome]